jgi:hypothetical protein
MGTDILLELNGIRGETRDDRSAHDAGPIHIESFSWGASQPGGHTASSHFDGRLLTADDLTRDQAARAEFEAFGGFTGGVVVAAADVDGRDLLLGGDGGDIEGDALAKAEPYYTVTLSDTLISG